MHLMRIRPHYFRAFGDSQWINLNSNLVVIYGPNGFGKTSLAEALEWLLYGKTHRRRRGEELSQRDYQGSYRNAHAPTGEAAFVECEVTLQDGSSHIIKRQLSIGSRGSESSATLVDGNSADFASIVVLEDEVFYPIIAQHSLQDFIHSRPKDRRDKISAAFGLEPLVRYKTVFDRARTRFQTNPPTEVITARTQLSRITQAMPSAPPLTALTQKWISGNIDRPQDAAELLRLTREFLQRQDGDWDTVVAELTTRRSEAARRVFDMSSIEVPTNRDQNLTSLRNQLGRVHQQVHALSQRLQAFASSVATVYSQALLQYWQTGLALAPAVGDQCPMCESNTLTVAKRAELQRRIDQSADYTKSLADLRQESNATVRLIQEVLRLARSVFPTFLDDRQRETLLTLYEGTEELCRPYLDSHDGLRDSWQQDERMLQGLENQVLQVPTSASTAATIQSTISSVQNLENDITSFIGRILHTSESYARTLSAFLQELEHRISSSDEVREIDAYLAPINGWSNVDIVHLYNNLLGESLDLVRRIEDHLQQKQTQCFSTKGQEINRWYDMMNRNAHVRYKRMEPGTDSLQLIAETFGVEINAVSCLSQCQLNCLGLSVHFVRSLTSGTPFSFLLMDDPVQSMDDDHRDALVIDVINELISTHRLQLIILSHVQGLVDSVWERYFHLQPLRLRISEFKREGPVIEEAETIQGCLGRARHLARGNEDNRRLALDCLRRGVELLIRAMCRVSNSPSPPDDATARQMIPFFRNCPNTTAQQGQDLTNTISFSDPGPHTQVGWAVPVEQQIVPHIDRTQAIAQRLSVW